MKILFEERKKIGAESLAEGNAQIIKIKYKIALRIAVEILFEARKKIATKSLTPQGNAQIILKILLKAKVSKTLWFCERQFLRTADKMNPRTLIIAYSFDSYCCTKSYLNIWCLNFRNKYKFALRIIFKIKIIINSQRHLCSINKMKSPQL